MGCDGMERASRPASSTALELHLGITLRLFAVEGHRAQDRWAGPALDQQRPLHRSAGALALGRAWTEGQLGMAS